MKKREVQVIEALRELGGSATAEEIAERLELSREAIESVLEAMDQAERIGHKGGDPRWRLKES